MSLSRQSIAVVLTTTNKETKHYILHPKHKKTNTNEWSSKHRENIIIIIIIVTITSTTLLTHIPSVNIIKQHC